MIFDSKKVKVIIETVDFSRPYICL